MAERRMFAKTIIDSDAFLEMPLSTQALYFHLSMRADDDGFLNNPKKIQRVIGGSEDDLKLLIAKKFVIIFESGVVVIKHWKMHNYLRKDRYNETVYQDEKSLLGTKENGSYTLKSNIGIPNGNHLDTQVRLGKDSIGKVSKEEYGEFENVKLSHDEYSKLVSKYSEKKTNDYIERLSTYIEQKGKRYKSHYATILTWIRKDENQKPITDIETPDYMMHKPSNRKFEKVVDEESRQKLLEKIKGGS